MIRLLLTVSLVILAATPLRAQPACPADFQNQPASLTCACSAEATQSRTVWGTGPYTSDSGVCRAAVHAGVIPATGGVVAVSRSAGLQSYAAGEANGVATLDYGPWDASFTIAAPGSATDACPLDFGDRDGTLSCTCTAEALLAGAVWGDGTYTTDSGICRAALHAGIVPASGGAVVVEPAPGEIAYPGSTANGVTSLPYGAWPASFRFRR